MTFIVPNILPHHFLFDIGDITFIRKFKFPNGNEKDKLMIVLNKNKDGDVTYLTFSFSTSQLDKNNITGLYRNHGCTYLGKKHFYFFSKNRVIGKDGFKFDVDTAVIFETNIQHNKASSLESYKPEEGNLQVKDKLIDSELKALLECIINSIHLPHKLKPSLEKVLAGIR